VRLLVVGAGATGGYFGGRLTQVGRDVTFLVRPARAAQLQRDGLKIKSPHGDVVLTPKFMTAADIHAPFDVVLVTVKAYGLATAMADFAPAVGADTMIVPVLNGTKHIDDLADRFSKKSLVGGVCKVATMVDDAGQIIQLADFQELAYGELDGAPSSRTDALHLLMKDAGFDARLTRDIVQELWHKWILLAALGGITTLMGGTVGEIAGAAHGPAFVRALLDEIVQIATALHHPPHEGFLANAQAMLAMKGSSLTASMFRDLQKGNSIEADHIIGDLVGRGQRAGVPTPLLSAAYTRLSVYQNRLST
jgi:2-dehydropantoate 2-reductase